jgi:hypothetical protein
MYRVGHSEVQWLHLQRLVVVSAAATEHVARNMPDTSMQGRSGSKGENAPTLSHVRTVDP